MCACCTLSIFLPIIILSPFPFSSSFQQMSLLLSCLFMFVCGQIHLIGVFCKSMNEEVINLSKCDCSLAILLRFVTNLTPSSSSNYYLYLPISPQSGSGLQSHDEMLAGSLVCIACYLVAHLSWSLLSSAVQWDRTETCVRLLIQKREANPLCSVVWHYWLGSQKGPIKQWRKWVHPSRKWGHGKWLSSE